MPWIRGKYCCGREREREISIKTIQLCLNQCNKYQKQGDVSLEISLTCALGTKHQARTVLRGLEAA